MALPRRALCQVTAGNWCATKPLLLMSQKFRIPLTALRTSRGSKGAMPDDTVREALLAFATILGALALLGAAATACED